MHRPTGHCAPRERPLLIAVHGGYWARRSSLGPWPKRLARDGYVVLEPGYRLNGDATWPAQRDDVRAVLAWATDRADEFGLDPERTVLLGSSAGGHLAVNTAITCATGTPETPPVRAVVALSPPLSPYRAWKDGERPTGPWRATRRRLRAAAAKLAGCAPSRDDAPCWDTWRDMVAKNHLGDERELDALLLHFADDMVPASHSEDYRDAHTAAGGQPRQVTVVTLPGRGHGMSLLDVPGVAPAIRAFLAAHTRLPDTDVPAEYAERLSTTANGST